MVDDYYVSSDDEEYYDDEDDRQNFELLEYGENYDSLRPEVPTSKVISKESLLAAQKDDVQRAMDVLSLKEYHARTLLIHYRWDVDNVLAVLVEKGKDRLYAEAGVMLVEQDDHVSSQLSSEVMCGICMDEIPADRVTVMDCGHCFCNGCWTEHFIVKINDGQSRRIKCMAYKCNAICDEAVIRNLVSARDPNLAEKFERFLLESYIEDNRMVKWCPSVPHCGNAIRIEEDELCEVECACGLQFCFNCLAEAHSPCSCQMWKLWCQKCQDESETVNYIAVNTKPCPKCGKLVEKNGGCNLVSCLCGQPFCWLCGAPTGLNHTWDAIADHSCGRFKEDEETKLEQAKRDLFRYTHYFNRYQAHIDSLKLEATLKQSIQEKISHLEERESTYRDMSWATNALYRLFRSRQIISYSYPFAYYMFSEDICKNEMTAEERTIKQNLFEDQQQQLEANMERLSLFIEEPFDEYSPDEIMELKMGILDLSTLTDNLCAKLYDCIEDDLLGSLKRTRHSIAPYKSNGVEKASELTVSRDTTTSNSEIDLAASNAD
ncbi:probable E3 ubiquitin-protein ligase ARI2 [Pyrus communis]|uniref:probable E3 ubiquitin-protein ligase ARI2 n=1 Tax=Pyrus communis TaxID=23211 RepID=UPI0035BF7B10